MAKFFIDRPVVAMVIAILMVMIGIAALVRLPISQFPNIAPPQIQLWARDKQRRLAEWEARWIKRPFLRKRSAENG